MKKWNAAEIVELSINETASGDETATYEGMKTKINWSTGETYEVPCKEYDWDQVDDDVNDLANKLNKTS